MSKRPIILHDETDRKVTALRRDLGGSTKDILRLAVETLDEVFRKQIIIDHDAATPNHDDQLAGTSKRPRTNITAQKKATHG
jgi:hypothetical protein